MRFEVYSDAGGGSRWRLLSSNGQNVASSGAAFATRSNATRAARAFARNAAAAAFEIYEDKSGQHRWRARARNGQIVASGGEAFSSKQNAERAADGVRAGVAKAADPRAS